MFPGKYAKLFLAETLLNNLELLLFCFVSIRALLN